ncbi:MAG: UDP-N-acetylmuramoyl-tripeptide--D-alanyl-D-alanine ligase, partial [Oscillospiraceae bacterium]|nr:UDP-N-acetylmuramoyl-tripeptide--D-alanyl-D-alanine ligase [Oscillospiraceae bacterium]
MILKIILIFIAASAASRALGELLFLQQNSYFNSHYLKWCCKNYKRYLSVFNIIAFILAIVSAVLSNAYIALASGVFILFDAVIHAPSKSKQKKGLVYTARVKRLCVTALILLALSVYFDMTYILLAAGVFSFAFVSLANILVRPVELIISNYYVNDAKKIIRSSKDLTVIGVTGSYGKTSVKFMLEKLLASKYNVLVTPESYNTTMGVVKTVRNMLKPYHEIFVCEMGAKNTGEIKEICDIVNPSYGVITSIGPQHLESFKTIENIINTKFELCDSLPENGKIFINFDNEYCRSKKCNKQSVSFGLTNGADYTAENISYSTRGVSFDVVTKSERVRFSSKLLGEHNVCNLICAIAVANSLGISLRDLTVPVQEVKPVKHRMEIINKGNGVIVIDDAFNSNPIGSKNAVETLGSMSDATRIVITPGMIELGEMEAELNRQFGHHIAENCDYAVLVGPTQTKPIADGLEDKNFPKEK